MRTLASLAAFGLLSLSTLVPAAETAPAPRPGVDLTGYRTAAAAVRADPKLLTGNGPVGVGYVGVEIDQDPLGKPVIDAVAPDSPAEAAGLRTGDVVAEVAGKPAGTPQDLRRNLRGLAPGEPVVLKVVRAGKPLDVTVTPVAVSRPLPAGGGRSILGIGTDPGTENGAKVMSVAADGGADRAGVKVGDVLLRIDGTAVTSDGLRNILSARPPGDTVRLLVRRGEADLELSAMLQAEATGGGNRGGWDDRLPTVWRKGSYRLAVVGVEFPDVKHNPKLGGDAWESALFSTGKYTGTNATGQKVYGSVADYYKTVSAGRFELVGKFVGWAEAGKNRNDYNLGTGTSTQSKSAFFAEVLDSLAAKLGKDALKDFDGIFFVHAGARVQTTRGGLFWPHKASFTHQGKRWSYFLVPEGGDKMTDISVICHEFGHMLGIPDLYARPENPGSEGVGVWCAMSQQNGGGRPQQFSAWVKEQLGWVSPAVIDPRVKQKLILAPTTAGPGECYKVPVRADGTEYFLLENRVKEGYDEPLPGEGLLIWRVVGGKVFLEESHGVEGASGPRVHLKAVPYPSPSNTAFTPYTSPSSRSQTGGGFDMHLTNIRRLPDGRITFHVGYEYQ